MKKLLSLALCFVLLASMFTVATGFTASAEGADGSFEYDINFYTNEAHIFAYTGEDTTVTIPSKIGDYTVVSIGGEAFSENEFIESVVIPDTVEMIFDYAFSYCSNLKDITISKNITVIGRDAFYGTAYYNDADNWVNSALYIDNYLISGHREVYDEEEFSFEIVESASGDFTVRANTVLIADYAFEYCGELSSITIPASVKYIGTDAFLDCTSLESITVDENSSSYISVDGVLFDKEKTELIKYPALKDDAEYTVPSTVVSIITSAFQHNPNITSVVIPNNVEYVQSYAFSNCVNLKTVTLSNVLEEIDDYTFYGCESLESVTIPDSVEYINDCAFQNCSSLKSAELSDNLAYIGFGAFENCSSLESINIPQNVKTIEYYAFYNCTSLEDITLGTSLKRIGDSAFLDTAFYNDVNNWDEDSVLYYNNYLISANKRYFDEDNFYYATESEAEGDYVIKEGTTLVAEAAFLECEKITSVKLADTVEYVGNRAFSYCTMLDTVYFNNKIKTIEVGLFDCSGIKSIDIPKSVTTIEDGAFSWCENLESIVIPANVKRIGSNLFARSENLTTVTLNEGLRYIDSYAFDECSSLKTISVPKSVIEIGEYAFGYYYDSEADDYVKVDGFVLDCGTNAFAYEYAVEYDIDYTYTCSSAKYGDCNADDKINMADVLMLRKYLAKWNVTPNLNNADCNADDKINMADVLLLRKYLAKWNVELGPSRAE